jgi:putative ABC transport system permease protein
MLLSLVAYGVMIPFRLLNFPDLTSEASYPLGGAICSSLIILNMGIMFSIFIATILAGIIGICTALIHLRFKVNSLLAGIILSTMVYSINLRIMGKPNLALFDKSILFAGMPISLKILLMLSIIIALAIAFILFLYSEKGLRLRAVGLNKAFANKQTISITNYTILGLFIANCYNGLAGSIMVQLQSYMDIGMGVGIVIHGLAALMIGETIIGNSTLKKQLLAPLVGALIYQQIQGLALFIGLAPSDLKFLTGFIVLAVIAIPKKTGRNIL